MTVTQILMALLVVVIWGLNFPICKIGLLEIPAFLYAALRFFLVAVVLIPISARPSGTFVQIVSLSLLLGVAHFGLFFFGLSFEVDASSAAILMQFGPPLAALLGIVVLGEQVLKVQIAGLCLACVGIIIVIGLPEKPPHIVGSLILLASASMWAIANVYMKRLKHIPVFTLWGWMSLFAGGFLFLFWLIFQEGALPPASTTAYLSVLWPAIFSTVIAYGLWTKLIHDLPLSKVAPFGLLVPVVGVLGSVLILGDSIDAWFGIGSVLVVSGVLCSSVLPTIWKRHKAKTSRNAS